MSINSQNYQGVNGPGIEILKAIDENIIQIKTDEISVLDVGFGDPGSFIYFHHVYGLKTYKGIDIMGRRSFNINIFFEDEIPEEIVRDGSSSPYERYGLFYKYVLSKLKDGCDKKLTKLEFDSIFYFAFQTKIQDFIESPEFDSLSPNIIVVSDLLHLFKDKMVADRVVSNLLNKLDDDGIIWIELFNWKSEFLRDRYPYSKKDIEVLEFHMDTIYRKDDSNDNQTLIIGKKKKSRIKDI